MEDVAFGEAEDYTPVHTITYADSYLKDLVDFNKEFFEKLGILDEIPSHVPRELRNINFLDTLNQGKVSLVFCPGRVSFLEHLYSFFDQQRIGIETNIKLLPRLLNDRFDDLLSSSQTRDKWLVLNSKQLLSDWSSLGLEEEIPSQDCNLAEAIFFLADRLFRGQSSRIVTEESCPAYIRTSDILGEYRLYVALVPRKLLISIFPKDTLGFAPFGVMET